MNKTLPISKKFPGASELSIPAWMEEPFRKEVAKMNKALTKRGLSTFDILHQEPYGFQTGQKNSYGEARVIDCLRITCYIPQIPDPTWQLVSILRDDSHVGGEFIVTNLADFEAVGMKITCDHCGEKRFRKLGFVLRNKNTLEIKTIGSTCLDEYLNRDVLNALNTMTKWLDRVIWPLVEKGGDYDGSGFGGTRFRGIAVDDITYAAALACGSDSKWANSKGYFNTILGAMLGTDRDGVYAEACQKYGERAQTIGKQVFEYLRSTEFRDTIDTSAAWGQNLKACFFHQDGTPKAYTTHSGLVGWAVFRRFENLNKPAVPAVAKVPSEHIGKVGEKVSLEMLVERIRYVESSFGSSTLVAGKDEKGNAVSFFLNGGKGNSIEQGQKLQVTGKVKSHGDFKGTKQTVLFFVKL
jgi:hypothetical protein